MWGEGGVKFFDIALLISPEYIILLFEKLNCIFQSTSKYFSTGFKLHTLELKTILNYDEYGCDIIVDLTLWID